MADTNPFANMGLGMMGNDASYAKQGMSGGDSSKSTALSKIVGKGFDWLGDQFSNQKPPEGSAPAPAFNSSNMTVMKPVVPANYGYSNGFPTQQPSAPVAPESQVTGVNVNAPTDALPTDNSQFTVGGYRKFLRPQGFGTVTQ